MKAIGLLCALGFAAFAGTAQAQSCNTSWNYIPDGGFEGDAPEAYSPCESDDAIGVLCIGPALMVTYLPVEGALPPEVNGAEHWPITFSIGDFTYSDYATYMAATGEFSFVRVAWDNMHPLFEALQSGDTVLLTLPDFDIIGMVSLSGSRGAISQVIEACQGN